MEERDVLLDKVLLGAERVSQMYYRLLLVVTYDEAKGSRYIAEALGIRRVDVGKDLGEELLEVPAKMRPLKVAGLLEDLLGDVGEDGLLLDHIEILFEKSLTVEPLTLLRSVSRQRLIVAVWRGEIVGGNVVYAIPGHPEYRSYPAQDIALVRFPE